jgi:hypothetical protein
VQTLSSIFCDEGIWKTHLLFFSNSRGLFQLKIADILTVFDL